MRKVFLITTLAFSSFATNAQTESINSMRIDSIERSMNFAGKHLITYKRAMTEAIGLQVVGAVFAGIGISQSVTYANNNSNTNTGYPYQTKSSTHTGSNGTAFIVTGGICSFVGWLFALSAHHEVKVAGMYLRNNGLSYVLPMKPKTQVNSHH